MLLIARVCVRAVCVQWTKDKPGEFEAMQAQAQAAALLTKTGQAKKRKKAEAGSGFHRPPY